MSYYKDKARSDGNAGKSFSWSNRGDFYEEKLAHQHGETAKQVRDYLASVTGSNKPTEVSGSLPNWVFIILRSFGPFVGFGALGFVTLGIISSIVMLAVLVYLEYFKPTKKNPPRYSDPVRMEKYRQRYKQLTGKEWVD